MDNVKVWRDTDHYMCKLSGMTWSITFAFPIQDLAMGASLQRMMNLKVRGCVNASALVVSPEELKALARKAMPVLREEVEAYFAQQEAPA